MATRDRGPFFTAEHGLLLRVRREYQWLTLKCVSIEVGLNHCPARELQGTKHSETVQNRTLPLPESASLSLEPLDETLSKLEEIEVKPFKPGFPISLWYRTARTHRRAFDFWGSDVRNHTTEGDTRWVNYSTRRFSSRSTVS